MVGVDVNPAYNEGGDGDDDDDDDDESVDEEQEIYYDDDDDDDDYDPREELQMSEKDQNYERFLEADCVYLAQLDERTGRLVPANGLYWI